MAVQVLFAGNPKVTFAQENPSNTKTKLTAPRRERAALLAALTAAAPVANNVAVPVGNWLEGSNATGQRQSAYGTAAVYAAVFVPLTPDAPAPNVADALYGGLVPPGHDVQYTRRQPNKTRAGAVRSSTLYAADHDAGMGDALPIVDVHARVMPTARGAETHVVWMSGVPNDAPSLGMSRAADADDVDDDAPAQTRGGEDSTRTAAAARPLPVTAWKRIVDATASRDVRTAASETPSAAHLGLLLDGAHDGAAARAAVAYCTAGVPPSAQRPASCGVTFVGVGGTPVRAAPRDDGAVGRGAAGPRPHVHLSVL